MGISLTDEICHFNKPMRMQLEFEYKVVLN